jgi:hypothetical protein
MRPRVEFDPEGLLSNVEVEEEERGCGGMKKDMGKSL